MIYYVGNIIISFIDIFDRTWCSANPIAPVRLSYRGFLYNSYIKVTVSHNTILPYITVMSIPHDFYVDI